MQEPAPLLKVWRKPLGRAQGRGSLGRADIGASAIKIPESKPSTNSGDEGIDGVLSALDDAFRQHAGQSTDARDGVARHHVQGEVLQVMAHITPCTELALSGGDVLVRRQGLTVLSRLAGVVSGIGELPHAGTETDGEGKAGTDQVVLFQTLLGCSLVFRKPARGHAEAAHEALGGFLESVP
ncbi:hypothetical protein [Streptomyces sp. MAI_2237]